MKPLRSFLLYFLFLSAAYLFVWPYATVVYEGTVLLHLFGGVLFLLLGLPFLWQKISCGDAAERLAWLLIAIGGVIGVVLVFTGTPRSRFPLLYAHIMACLAGGVVLVAAWAGRRGWLVGSSARAALRCGFSLALAAGLAAGAWWVRTVPFERAYRIANPAIAPASMDSEGDGPSGPFFPSSAQTPEQMRIAKEYFMESQSCERCHSDIYKQWQSSMHHFSSFNNQWYRKSIEYMQDTLASSPHDGARGATILRCFSAANLTSRFATWK